MPIRKRDKKIITLGRPTFGSQKLSKKERSDSPKMWHPCLGICSMHQSYIWIWVQSFPELKLLKLQYRFNSSISVEDRINSLPIPVRTSQNGEVVASDTKLWGLKGLRTVDARGTSVDPDRRTVGLVYSKWMQRTKWIRLTKIMLSEAQREQHEKWTSSFR